jgi:alanine racemase
MHYAKALWRKVWDDMCTGACSEEQVVEALTKFNPQVSEMGLIDPKLYISYDKAMHRLGIGNRNKLRTLANKYGIQSCKINNVPIGFHVKDIDFLKEQLNKRKK